MDKIEKKRARGSNFSKEEELFLLAEVEKLKYIIENKQTDKVHSSEKNEAWNIIKNKFNAQTFAYRTGEQLKIKYENLKLRARKYAAGQKYSKGTGGGPALELKDPIMEGVLNIINKKSVSGFLNPFDSNAVEEKRHEVSAEKENIFPEIISIEAVSDELNINYEVYEAMEGSSEVLLELVPSCAPSTSKDINSGNSGLLTIKEKKSTQELNNIEDNIESIPKTKKWINYTPKRLKEPMSKKLRQNKTSIKDEYYKKKIKYLEEETEKCFLQKEDLQNKIFQDKEIYHRKIVLLDLEIKQRERDLEKNN